MDCYLSKTVWEINKKTNGKINDDIILIYTSSINAYIIQTRYLDKDLKDNFIKIMKCLQEDM